LLSIRAAGKAGASFRTPKCAGAKIVCYNSGDLRAHERSLMAATNKAGKKVVKKNKPAYRRVLLKLSGESFQGPQGFGIHGETIQAIARELKDVHALACK